MGNNDPRIKKDVWNWNVKKESKCSDGIQILINENKYHIIKLNNQRT